MAFPSLSDITEAVKGMVSGEPESTDATSDAVKTAVEAATGETKEPTTETTTTQEPETVTPETSPEPLSASVSKVIAEKGARAFLAELPEDIRKQIGPELNKEWYTKLNARDEQIRGLAAQNAAMPGLIKQIVSEQFDAIRMEGMSEEDKKSFLKDKELAALREQTKGQEPQLLTPQQLSEVFASTPLANAFWEAVNEVGLPVDPANPDVNRFYNDVLREFPNTTSAKHGAEVIKTLANKYRKQTKTEPTDIEAIVTKRVAESLEAALDARLKKMGLLKSDTGKPGASAGVTSRPKTYEDARKGAVEMLSAAER